MASTFRRRDTATGRSSSLLGLSGTKPWTGGITLTSTGLRDWDQLLGGGQPLGTSIWLEQDRWTQSLAQSLVQYWCSEALSQNQHLLIPTESDDTEETDLGDDSPWEETKLEAYLAHCTTRGDIRELLRSLPRNLHIDKQTQLENAASTTAVAAASTALETLVEEQEQEDDQAEEGLEIAWQYRKDVQRERLGHSGSDASVTTRSSDSQNVFCHSYDLQGRLNEQIMDMEASCTVIPIHGCGTGQLSGIRTCGFQFYRRLVAELEALMATSPRKVVRLLFYRCAIPTLSISLPLLLTHIRTNQLPVVILVAVQPWTSTAGPQTLRLLQRACDVVLETEGFASRREYPPPPEFRILHGLLKIRKVSTVTAATAHGGGHFADMTVSKRAAANLYGLKRDRRKLHIQLLHIPPEDYAEGGGSVGSGGVRSGAGLPAKKELPSTTTGCGTSGASPLDF